MIHPPVGPARVRMARTGTDVAHCAAAALPLDWTAPNASGASTKAPKSASGQACAFVLRVVCTLAV
jgi:hypothetical protein